MSRHLSSPRRWWVMLLLLLAACVTPAYAAPKFPPLTGRVVDQANILDPAQEAALTEKLAALQQQSGRQLVVATISDLQGNDIADYGYQLGRAWGIGQKGANDGALLIVAPNERRARIEAGYGLEPILTDAQSSLIIQESMIPRFKANDYPGGIAAGVDAVAQVLTLPPDEARAQAAKAEQRAHKSRNSGSGGGFILFGIILFFFVIPFFRAVRGGRRYSRGGIGTVGNVLLWSSLLNGRDNDGGGWGGGGGGGGWGGGGGGGGFSGGGGSFGGGGASGGW